jgi:hypothetical protein
MPDGTVVQAVVGGVSSDQASSTSYQKSSAFSLNVPVYDLGNPGNGGGNEGDTIQFKIVGLLADQTGMCHTGKISSLI